MILLLVCPNYFAYSSEAEAILGIYPLYDASGSFDGHSAYLFAGCSSSETMPCLLKLNDMPLTTISTPSQPRLSFQMPSSLTIALLVCDPKHSITTSYVVASGTTLTASSVSEDPPRQNNLPQETVELIFSVALLGALSPLSASPGSPSPLSTIAAQVFLNTHGQNVKAWTNQRNFTADIPDLDTIQKNMNNAMVSASKAFLIKPAGQGLSQFSGFQTTTIPATIERPVILLVGSRPFIFATIGILSLIILFGCFVFLDVRRQYRLPLNLRVALRILNHGSVPIPAANDTEKSPQDKPLPLIIGNYHPLSLDESSDDLTDQHTSDVHWYWPRKYIFARVVLFLVLQLGYYGFAIAGHVRPYNLSRVSPIPLTEFFAELKGAFIVAFTVWHTLSIALLSDILFTIFSLEWAVQAERKRALEPGETDRVSTLASGLFDRVKYAFAKGQGVSAMFRYALAASIVLMVLSATGPGCFTLSTTAVIPKDITIRNGNPISASFLSAIQGPLLQNEVSVLERIAAITQLEQLEGFTWGYEMPPNSFFTWPYSSSGQLIQERATMKYLSRTNYFNFKCRWETPVAGDLELQTDIEKPITTGVHVPLL